MIPNTIGIVGMSGCMACNPSMAEATDMGGVIIPSASKVAPPISAGKTNHGVFRRRTNAYKENIPPSPLLSARRVMITYLMVV